MDVIDEVARRHDRINNVLTDFFLASPETSERYKVTETGRPVRIVGGEVMEYRFDYVVSLWGPTGWIEVVRLDQDHADDATVAAQIAERILTS